MIYLRVAVSPFGVAEDNTGILWINDHATNLFLRFDPKMSQVTKYSTSLPTSRNDTTTLLTGISPKMIRSGLMNMKEML